MGLASSMSTALTGMNASQSTIDVVGNNLANSNTVGFKASDATFATQFLQTQSEGSAPSENNGGTDPEQFGLGVQVAGSDPNFGQGTVQTDSTPTHMAIQGDGFFIVQSSGSLAYTRNGVFKLNALNQLVNDQGDQVMGFQSDAQYKISATTLQPITLPLGTAEVAAATQNAYLQGSLSPAGTLATQGTILQSDVLGDAGYTQPVIDPTNPPTATTVGGSNTWLSAPTVTQNSAASSFSTGTYNYKIVYTDSQGNATTSVNVAAQSMDNSHTVSFSSFATPPGGWTGWQVQIYRQDPSSSSYNLMSTITSPSSSSTYTDTGAAAGTQTFTDPGTLNGQYQYYITYATTSGYGTGQESFPVSIGNFNVSNGQVQLDKIPFAANNGQWSAVRIYRSLPNATGSNQLYYVGGMNVGASATSAPTFVDNTTTLDTTKPMSWNGPPISADTTMAVNLRRYNTSTGSWDTLFTPGTFSFTGNKGGDKLTAKSLTITNTTTVRQLMTFMSNAMGIQTGLGDNAGTQVQNSRMVFTGNVGTSNALSISLNNMAMVNSNGTSSNINLPFNSTQSANGESAMTDFVAYDSLGISLNVHVTMALVSQDSTSTTYRWYADCPNNSVSNTGQSSIAVGTGTVTFNNLGAVQSTANDQVQIFRSNVAAQSPLVFKLDFSKISGLATSKSSISVSNQDGSAPGVLDSFIVGNDGLISGVFSNGITRDLAQLQLARFANASGLVQQGGNKYTPSVNSGLPIQGNPGQLGLGTVQGGATELSNTDVGNNLIKLILASTMYRSNANVITTVQELFTQLLALNRNG